MQTAGTGGQPTRLYANFFKLNTPEKLVVYNFDVKFEPEVEATVVRRALLYEGCRAAFNNSYLFDGGANIKSCHLPPGVTAIGQEAQFNATRKTDGAIITMTIKLTEEVDWGSTEMLRLYNTQVRRNLMHLKYVLIGRYYYNPAMTQDIDKHKVRIRIDEAVANFPLNYSSVCGLATQLLSTCTTAA